MACYLVEVSRRDDWKDGIVTDTYGVVANTLARVEALMERQFEVGGRRGPLSKITRMAEDVVVDAMLIDAVATTP